MKQRMEKPVYLVFGMVVILVMSMYTLDMRSGFTCERGDFSDESVAASRSISVEMIHLLRSERGLTNPEICVMPQSKLDRAIFRVENPKPDHPGEAAAFRTMQNQDENGVIPPNAIGMALSHVRKMPTVSLVPWHDDVVQDQDASDGISPEGIPGFESNANLIIDSGTWTWLGPGNIGGRVRSIVIHPTEPNRMWAGAVSGGIWYSNDGGASWAPVDDFMINLAVATIIMDPTDVLTMYAGTGEGFYNGDAIRGAGVFKSTDGGVTWGQIPATATANWYWVNRLAISPDGNTLLAATRTGIWRSVNAGVSWTQVNTDSYVKDVDFHPTDSDKAVAGSAFCTAYYSTNGGLNWNSATGLPTCTSGGWLARVEVAYAPGDGNKVYASVNNNNGEVWSSANGGQNYTIASTGYSYLGSQGWYDNVVWVDPTDATNIIVGGIDLWRSTNAGITLTKISEWWRAPISAHADHHAIVAHPNFDGSTNKTVFFGNDGGVYMTEDVYTVSTGTNNNGWIELNNALGITQFYGAAGNVSSGVVVGGTQDNGTLRYAGDSEGWTKMYGGDGGFSASDPTDPDYFYGEYVRLQIHRSTNGGINSSYIYSGISDAGSCANFIAPFILDPNNPNTLLAGGCSLWRSTNVKAITPSWAAIKSSVGSNISAIAVAPGNSDLIWVGHNNGNVYLTNNGTDSSPTWTRVDTNTPPLPDRYVPRITIDPNDHDTVYVTFGGFSADNVYRTTNNGANWVDITGAGSTGLPDAPVRSLVIHPDDADKLYVGTEVGIFSSVDGGAHWAVPQDGPANVSVDELFWMDRTLVAATHGRGIYEVNLNQGVEVLDVFTTDDSLNPKTDFSPGEIIRWVMTVENHTVLSTTVAMTWDVVDPFGVQVHYWHGDVEIPMGESGLYVEGTVDDVRGTYVFTGTVDHQGDVSQDTTTYLVPSAVLLVDDDDNDPDVIAYYTNTLETLGVTYDIWDTGNSDDNEPLTTTLSAYKGVIWFSGASENGNEGPGGPGETALASWLDQNGGCLMISSQDYPLYKGLTTFMEDYLGVASLSGDIQYASVTGQGSVFGGSGLISLDTTIFVNWSDEINPDGTAEAAFSYNGGNAAVNKSNGLYKTTFWGFPFEMLPTPADRQDVIGRFLSWCGLGSYQVYVPLIVK